MTLWAVALIYTKKITDEQNRLMLQLINLISKDHINKTFLSVLIIYCIWKTEYKNSKFKFSASAWDDEFESPNGQCSVLDININIFFQYIQYANTPIKINKI